MELALEGWKVKAALIALACLVVAAPFVKATKSNRDRAEDWHRRAVVAEESVGGLRVVIAQRSRALNQRTLQANRLVSELRSSGTVLRRSKSRVGSLTRRQRELASENSRILKERGRLQARLRALEKTSSRLNSCARSLGQASPGKGQRTVAAVRKARLAACRGASASFEAYLERFG
jgi:chromosome segregation ATPase